MEYLHLFIEILVYWTLGSIVLLLVWMLVHDLCRKINK